jgi:hypothetical protein
MAWINLNHTTPAAPTGAVNVTFQKGTGTGTQADPTLVSGYVPPASTSAAGAIKFDGTNAHVLCGDGTWRAIAVSDIPNLDTAKVTTGTFDIARIPDLAASKITTGTLSMARLASSLATGVIGVSVDGGASTPLTGSKGFVKVPYACTVTGWTILADQSGSCAFDVKRAVNIAGLGSTSSIVSASPPTLSAATGVDSTTLTGWTTALSAGDYLEFVLNSVSTIKRALLQLTVTKG